MTAEEFNTYLSGLGINDPAAGGRYEQYLSLILAGAARMNITAITDPEAIRSKHFRDSLSLYKWARDARELIDVGSGAGLPGIALKIACPALKVVLLEPTEKKCRFLAEAIDYLKLRDISVICGRAEDQAHKGLRATLVTARAVAGLRELSELCLPLVRQDGLFIAMKGANGAKEEQEARPAVRLLGGELEQQEEYELPEGDRRVNLIYRKIARTPSGYPRRYAEIKRKPL